MSTSVLSQRIRRIRECRNYKQTWVASQMNVSQQGYSSFEKTAGNARLNSLRKFCEVCKVSLSFLVSEIPITEENMQYAGLELSEMISKLKNQDAKVKIYEDLILAGGLRDTGNNTAIGQA